MIKCVNKTLAFFLVCLCVTVETTEPLSWTVVSLSPQVRGLRPFPGLQPPGAAAGSAGRRGDGQRRGPVQIQR